MIHRGIQTRRDPGRPASRTRDTCGTCVHIANGTTGRLPRGPCPPPRGYGLMEPVRRAAVRDRGPGLVEEPHAARDETSTAEAAQTHVSNRNRVNYRVVREIYVPVALPPTGARDRQPSRCAFRVAPGAMLYRSNLSIRDDDTGYTAHDSGDRRSRVRRGSCPRSRVKRSITSFARPPPAL